MSPKCCDFRTGALVLATFVAASSACRSRPADESRSVPAAATSEYESLAEALGRCIACRFPQPELTPVQTRTLKDMFDGFAGDSCAGCHNTPFSLGGVGNFAANQSAGAEEFFKGIAYRHHLTREIAAACFAPSPGRDKLLGRLHATRTESTPDLALRLRGESHVTKGGVPFFKGETELEKREVVLSFLQGGFEVPASPGERIHEVVYRWVDAGARFAPETHRDILIDVARLHSLLKDGLTAVPGCP